jgi:hypothetical protein
LLAGLARPAAPQEDNAGQETAFSELKACALGVVWVSQEEPLKRSARVSSSLGTSALPFGV